MTGAPAESAYLGIMQMEATVRQDFALEIFIFFEHLQSKAAQPNRQLYVSLGSVFSFVFSLCSDAA